MFNLFQYITGKTAGFTKRPSAAFPHPSSLRYTKQCVSFLRISEASHPGIFEQAVPNRGVM
jgi:hypothetical protein